MRHLFGVLAVFLILAGNAQAVSLANGWQGSYTGMESLDALSADFGASFSLPLTEDSLFDLSLARITGLEDGDTVTAGFWVYDTFSWLLPSARIFGIYTREGEGLDAFAGIAGGESIWSGSSQWEYVEYTWTFDAGTDRTGMIVGAFAFPFSGAAVYLDMDRLSAPGHAVINGSEGIPAVPVPAAVLLLGSGLIGVLGLKRRRA